MIIGGLFLKSSVAFTHISLSILICPILSIKPHFPVKKEEQKKGEMSDWGPVLVAVVLFVVLMPGLLIQIPGRHRVIEFGNFQTSGASILVHSIIYLALISIFLLAVGVHMYIG